MAKKILELKQFMAGIVGSPSDADIPEEAAVFSSNIDAISEEGKLKGVKSNSVVSDFENPEGTLRLFPFTNTGVNATPLNGYTHFDIYFNRGETHKKTFTPSEAEKSLRTLYAANALKNHIISQPGFEIPASVEYSIEPSSTTANIAILTAPLSATATQMFVSSLDFIYTGFDVTINDGSNSETVRVSSFSAFADSNNGNGFPVDIERTNTPYAHDNGASIAGYTDFNLLDFLYQNTYEEVRIVGYNGSTVVTDYTSTESQTELDWSPKNIISTMNKSEEHASAQTDLVFYNKDEANDSNEIKVFENFYNENGSNGGIITSDVEGEWSLGGQLEKVALDAGAGSVYIGTGNKEENRSKWFGKIDHKQFGQKIDGYHLLDSELQAIDEGNTVQSMDFMHHPLYAETKSGTPDIVRRRDNILATSPNKRTLFVVKNILSNGQSNTMLGKQFESSSLGFVPGAVCSSKSITAKLADSSLTAANRTPYVPSGTTWNFDSYTNVDSDISGHTVNTNLNDNSNPMVMQSYAWVAGKSSYNQIYAKAIRYVDDRTDTDPGKVVVESLGGNLGFFRLDWKLTTTDEMNTNIGAGKVIKRPPPVGSYISDILEKDGYLYIQYYRDTGFTHYDEWLYAVNISDIEALSDLSGQSVTAKPITPAFVSLKEYQKDYKNDGHEFWVPDDVFNANDIKSRKKVGIDGIYQVYSNYYKWRNCDMLGFNWDGKHITKKLTVDDIEIEPDTDSGWNKHYADDDGDKTSRVHGWNENDSSREYNDPNPYIGNRIDGEDFNLGKSYGFKAGTYRIHPHQKGLTNYRNSTSDIGVVAFITGEQLTSRINIRQGYDSVLKWNKAHRYHWIKNVIPPEFKTWNEWAIVSASRHNHGALQRTLASGGQVARAYIDMSQGWPITLLTKLPNEAFDGTFASGWGGSGVNGQSWTENEADNLIDGRIKRIQSTLRIGSMYSQSINGGNDGEAANDYQMAAHRSIIPFETSGSSSSQPGNNHITKMPSSRYAIKSISKGEKFTSGSADNVGLDTNTNDKIYITAKIPEESAGNTLIYKWNKVNPSASNGELLSSQFTADTTFGPLLIQNIGSPVMTLSKSNSDIRAHLYTTAGKVKNGFAKYDPSNNQAQSSENDANHSNIDDNLFWNNAGGELEFGFTFTFQEETNSTTVTDDDGNEVTTWDTGNFNAGGKYYYKVALVYDGYQEGPISNVEETAHNTDVKNYLNNLLTITINDPPKRVSHIAIYRRNDNSQTTGTDILDYYRLVTEISLDDDWSQNADGSYTIQFEDTGSLGATYESITGMPESLEKTNINYGISTTALGHLVVGDCYHPEIKQAQNFIFKSQPGSFSNFNWSKDYTILPNKPTAIKWFAGKLYVFDLHNMWRINFDNMVIEDSFEGIGCIGPESILVTDLGMFFCDYQGMYWHNGKKAENISRDVLQNSAASDLSKINTSTDYNFDWCPWQRINHKINPHILYNPVDQSVLYCFINQNDTTEKAAAWKFSLTRKRWDFIELEDFQSVMAGSRNDIYLGGTNKVVKLFTNDFLRKKSKWVSKSFNMGSLSEKKVLNKIKIQFNTPDDAAYFKINATNFCTYIDNVKKAYNEDSALSDFTVIQEDSSLIYKPKNSKTFKKLRLEFIELATEVDSITIIYRNKSIK